MNEPPQKKLRQSNLESFITKSLPDSSHTRVAAPTGIERSKKPHRVHKKMNANECTGGSSPLLPERESDGNGPYDDLVSQPLSSPRGYGGSLCTAKNAVTRSSKSKDEMNKMPECLENCTVDHQSVCKHMELWLKRTADVSDLWDEKHVRMPCSEQNMYPLEKGDLIKRWILIEGELMNLKQVTLQFHKNPHKFLESGQLRNAIIHYNSRYQELWDFTVFDRFCNSISPSDLSWLFEHTLPGMVDLALKLPKICKQPIPLLRKDIDQKVTFSQEEIACLLANAFFCTFPRRNASKKGSEYSYFPTINFNSLFAFDEKRNDAKVEKLKCIVHYFKRVLEEMPQGCVTFHRQCLGINFVPDWDQCRDVLTDLYISSNGTIEEEGEGMLQVDFANKYVGGGVLSAGCVQEEIRFLICPEMIISRLITEELGPEECLIMTGCEQFSDYEGYSDSFRWLGNHNDVTRRDKFGRRYNEVVAIDAMTFNWKPMEQFSTKNLRRELNKAYCGFFNRDFPEKFRPAVATGNWGCGAFGGDHWLKALIQLMAASVAKRDVCYFTFGNISLTDDIYQIHTVLKANGITVGEIFKDIEGYYQKYKRKHWPRTNICGYIHSKLDQTDKFPDFTRSPASYFDGLRTNVSISNEKTDNPEELIYRSDGPEDSDKMTEDNVDQELLDQEQFASTGTVPESHSQSNENPIELFSKESVSDNDKTDIGNLNNEGAITKHSIDGRNSKYTEANGNQIESTANNIESKAYTTSASNSNEAADITTDSTDPGTRPGTEV